MAGYIVRDKIRCSSGWIRCKIPRRRNSYQWHDNRLGFPSTYSLVAYDARSSTPIQRLVVDVMLAKNRNTTAYIQFPFHKYYRCSYRYFSDARLEDIQDENTVEPLTEGTTPENKLDNERKLQRAKRRTLPPREDDEPTIEETYSRTTQLDHILLRPGMYVGLNARLPPDSCWVLEEPPSPNLRHIEAGQPIESIVSNQTSNDRRPSNLRIVKKECALAPALNKVFDEILVNASDNRLRNPETCTRIDVTIDPGNEKECREPFVSVFNDGKGIPVEVHRGENLYVPEMLFGNLLTGSNFDDSQKRITGGRHGYGAKLANIFSKSFTIETLDSRKGLLYRQTWSNNMTEMSPPEIEKVELPDSSDYTCISFVPDLARLVTDDTGEDNHDSQATISESDYATMCRRVVDVAGCADGKLVVTLNGVDVSQASFADYCQLYQSDHAPPICYHKMNARWKIAVGLSESGSFESVSFVNGICTSLGGTHVDILVQQITAFINEYFSKVDRELREYVTEKVIKRHLFLCCDALIENPTFNSQTKEKLTLNLNNHGTSYTIEKAFLLSLVVSLEDGGPGILEELVKFARGKQLSTLSRAAGGAKITKRQLLAIPKLDDAHKAGKTGSTDEPCTIILTEGDSAKALAISGLEVVGRDRFGVFPLRGKLLNIRHASGSQVANNAEVKALCSILGLDKKKKYKTIAERQELRYGRVLLMTDQDTDGSHIKGLVLNFFRYWWPDLLKPPIDQPPDTATLSFFAYFVTPLLKATKKGQKKEVLAFYSLSEYNEWRLTLNDDELNKWNVKYYKGLGTSTAAEAKDYFEAFDKNLRPFRWKSDIDGECLDMAFDKAFVEERKNWILDVYDAEASVSIDPSIDNEVSYEDFVNKELIHFSHADNIRSIPSAIDGLKPSQRKVLYACFKRGLKSEIKVAQLTGYCAEHTAYHHGEASLQGTIIGMAQDFVGSNNINLLEPSGQFGTRRLGGSDAASPRYIFTRLTPIARRLFPEEDDILLTYREDDGQMIEPEYYCPVIPFLLVNGAGGIGTGWSTVIPSYNPRDILNYVRKKLDGSTKLPVIRPYGRGFTGKFEAAENEKKGFLSVGRVTKVKPTSVLIDELPLQYWTEKYKERQLLKMQEKGMISDFVENHTSSNVSFLVSFKSAKALQLVEEKNDLEVYFKLKRHHRTSNMHAFDSDYNMTKFETPEAIVEAYFPPRFALYEDRKSVLESEMTYSALLIRNKARFIESVIAGDIDLTSGRKSKEETISRLKKLQFVPSTELRDIRSNNAPYHRRKIKMDVFTDTSNDQVTSDSEYDYLLSMPISSLTSEKISSLRDEAVVKEKELEDIKATSASDLWRSDLDKLEPFL